MDLRSEEWARAARNEMEREIETALAGMVESFLGDVARMGGDAIEAPSLLAAGRRRDPFAFTNVMERWYKGIRMIGGIENISDTQIREILAASSLPVRVYEQVREELMRADREDWTHYQTTRHLSRILIPKESSGKWDSRSDYRVAVSRMARTIATENFNRTVERLLGIQGIGTKVWKSKDDEAVRTTHAFADEQEVPLNSAFIVGGHALRYPGDPLAPIGETANCRCVIVGGKDSDMGNLTAGATARRTAPGGARTTFSMTLADTADDVAEEKVEDTAETSDPETGPAIWTGVIGMEQTMTGDGRMIEAGALRHETPLPLRYVSSDVGAHDGAQVAGTIQHIEIDSESGHIRATGTFDMNSEVGREAHRQVLEGLTTGVSMDLDDVSFEVRVAEELIRESDAQVESEMGIAPADADDDGAVESRAVVDGKVVMMQMNSDDEVHVTTSARIRAATIVAIPAFAEAQIHVVDEDDVDDAELIEQLDEDDVPEDAPAEGDEETFNWVEDVGGLPAYIRDIADALMRNGMGESRAIATAVNTVKRWARGGTVRANGGPRVGAKTIAKAAAAVAEWEAKKIQARALSSTADDALVAAAYAGAEKPPPRVWFDNPNLREPTPITVTEEGRVYGHLATWDSCHIAHPDFCTSPPRSQTDYAYFHTGALDTDGGEVSVGHLTLNTTHAKDHAKPMAAIAHYENTGLTVADVRAGEDSHGIWISGAVRPSAAADDVKALKAAPLSGDWRRIRGNLELVAALAVNVPGFPIPRPKGLTAGGHMQSLVASGLVPPKKVKRPGTPGALSSEDLRYLKALANRERRNRADALAARIAEDKRQADRSRIRALAATLVPLSGTSKTTTTETTKGA